MWSFDFAEVERLQANDDWEAAARLVVDAAREWDQAGARRILICSNTMHRCADAVEAAVDAPLIHIADATADAVLGEDVGRVGLLGTRYTMEHDFYRGRLTRVGLDVRTPDADGREFVHRVIYEELCQGVVRDASKRAFVRLAEEMARDGAGGVILGCTEVGMLLAREDVSVPLFDTTEIHARAAVEFCLS